MIEFYKIVLMDSMKGKAAVMRWFWFLCLTAGAVSDVRERQVSCRLLIVCAVFGWAYGWKADLSSHILGLAIGGTVLVISKLTRGAVGAGDGWFLVAGSGYLKAEETALLLLGGLAVSWVWSLGLVLYRAWGGGDIRKDTLPFLACMWPIGMWLLVQ